MMEVANCVDSFTSNGRLREEIRESRKADERGREDACIGQKDREICEGHWSQEKSN